ncbi:MAG: cytochrome bc complex cytochrome b subunit [Chthonomonadetes bacterium]|nr:cytochrome bc complex cytochrome b subunit [Chthonomonadetes bacterium]
MAHLIEKTVEREPTPSRSDGQPMEPVSPRQEAGWIGRLRDWIEERTGIFAFAKHHLDEPMPPGVGWWQTLGNLLLTLLIFQFITGFALAMFYAPTPDHAHESVRYIMEEVPLGAFIRGLHHWGSSFIILVVILHILRVFFWGSYKKPRELTWLVGVAIFQVMMAFAFTGYLLIWDQKAYWATVVGTRFASTVPVIGDWLMHFLRGGEEVGALTLTRFYAIHIMLLPVVLVLLTAAHLYLVRRLHIAGPVVPQKGKPQPFYPYQLFRDAVVVMVGVGALVTCALLFKPALYPVADPSGTNFTPRPEWYFLGLYELLKLMPPKLEILGTVVIPGLVALGMILLPWLDRSPSRHPARRMWVIEAGLIVIFLIGTLTLKGILSEHPMPPATSSAVSSTASLPQ